jgi:hypothetical protein
MCATNNNGKVFGGRRMTTQSQISRESFVSVLSHVQYVERGSGVTKHQN